MKCTTTRRYESDQRGLGPWTREQLVEHVLAGDTLTLLGVPNGSERRRGIDRDANGLVDGDERVPALSVERSEAGLTISWAASSLGTVLEFNETLPPSQWRTETSVRHHHGEHAGVTVPAAVSARFYRLRRL